jgi:hypothetical protein
VEDLKRNFVDFVRAYSSVVPGVVVVSIVLAFLKRKSVLILCHGFFLSNVDGRMWPGEIMRGGYDLMFLKPRVD